MKKIIAVFLCASALALTSCTAMKTGFTTEYTKADMTVFDTETVIVGYDYSKASFEKKAEVIMDELREYHKLYDIYNSYEGINNLKTVNDNAGKAAVSVDDRIIDLLNYSKEIYTLTNEKTNVALGGVLSIWHKYREEGKELPPAEKLQAAAKHTKIECIEIDQKNKTVYITDSEASIDVGAVAKGFAVDRCVEMIEKKGWDNIGLSVGGNVHTIGLKGDGTKWITGITNPDKDAVEAYVCRVELEGGMSLVTSGSYQRYYEVNEKRYHHIINPETLMPLDNFVSVSIMSESSALGDALSTALFNMSEEEGREMAKTAQVEVMWVYPNGEIAYTDGFSQKVVR